MAQRMGRQSSRPLPAHRLVSRTRSLLLLCIAVVLVVLSQRVLAQAGQLDLSLRLVDHWDGIEATAGQSNPFLLEVENMGADPITGIALTTQQPEGWLIELAPQEIASLGPGRIQTVDVDIRPPKDAIRGEQRISLIADANELTRVQRFRVTVKTPQSLWIGASVVAAVVAGFVWVYLRFGRQP